MPFLSQAIRINALSKIASNLRQLARPYCDKKTKTKLFSTKLQGLLPSQLGQRPRSHNARNPERIQFRVPAADLFR
jgi:hypothetical protein